MKKTSEKKQFAKFLIVGCLGLSVVLGSGECQAYFKGAPAYNSNYRPIYAHMRVETYVDLSSINIVQNDNTWLVFNVLTVNADEDSDIVRENNKTIRFKVNKHSREAWVANNSDWNYINFNRSPYGYEQSAFVAVNMCYEYMYGEFLNDSSGSAISTGSDYKGK